MGAAALGCVCESLGIFRGYRADAAAERAVRCVRGRADWCVQNSLRRTRMHTHACARAVISACKLDWAAPLQTQSKTFFDCAVSMLSGVQTSLAVTAPTMRSAKRCYTCTRRNGCGSARWSARPGPLRCASIAPPSARRRFEALKARQEDLGVLSIVLQMVTEIVWAAGTGGWAAASGKPGRR